MRKIISTVILICMFIALFVGFTKKNDSSQFAQKFIKTYFTITDYTKIRDISDEKFISLYVNNYSKQIHNLMTEQAFKNDMSNRYHINLISSAVRSKFNIQVQNIKIKKSYQNKDGSITYDYTASLNLLFSNKKQIQSFTGQISIKKINKNWKVTINWFDSSIIKILEKSILNGEKGTIPKAKVENSNQLSVKEKLDDFEYMYKILKENYPFFEVNKRLTYIDWLNKKEEYIKMIKSTISDDDFFNTLNIILGDLNNGHTGMIGMSAYMGYKHLYEEHNSMNENEAWIKELNKPKALLRYGVEIQGKESNSNLSSNASSNYIISNNVDTQILKDGEVAYLGIHSFNSDNIKPDMEIIKPFLWKIKDYKALIIDIRGNGGGDSTYWSDNIVPMLINKPLKYLDFLVYRGGEFAENFIKCRMGSGYSGLQSIKDIEKEGLKNMPPEINKDFQYYLKDEEQIEPKDSVGFKGKIYLLVDGYVYSSSEMLATFAKNSGFATLVGERTGGDGIGSDPLICVLPNSGFAFRFSQQMGLTADGTCDDEYETEPDIQVPAQKGATLLEDEAVKKVLELVK